MHNDCKSVNHDEGDMKEEHRESEPINKNQNKKDCDELLNTYESDREECDWENCGNDQDEESYTYDYEDYSESVIRWQDGDMEEGRHLQSAEEETIGKEVPGSDDESTEDSGYPESMIPTVKYKCEADMDTEMTEDTPVSTLYDRSYDGEVRKQLLRLRSITLGVGTGVASEAQTEGPHEGNFDFRAPNRDQQIIVKSHHPRDITMGGRFAFVQTVDSQLGYNTASYQSMASHEHEIQNRGGNTLLAMVQEKTATSALLRVDLYRPMEGNGENGWEGTELGLEYDPGEWPMDPPAQIQLTRPLTADQARIYEMINHRPIRPCESVRVTEVVVSPLEANIQLTQTTLDSFFPKQQKTAALEGRASTSKCPQLIAATANRYQLLADDEDCEGETEIPEVIPTVKDKLSTPELFKIWRNTTVERHLMGAKRMQDASPISKRQQKKAAKKESLDRTDTEPTTMPAELSEIPTAPATLEECLHAQMKQMPEGGIWPMEDIRHAYDHLTRNVTTRNTTDRGIELLWTPPDGNAAEMGDLLGFYSGPVRRNTSKIPVVKKQYVLAVSNAPGCRMGIDGDPSLQKHNTRWTVFSRINGTIWETDKANAKYCRDGIIRATCRIEPGDVIMTDYSESYDWIHTTAGRIPTIIKGIERVASFMRVPSDLPAISKNLGRT